MEQKVGFSLLTLGSQIRGESCSAFWRNKVCQVACNRVIGKSKGAEKNKESEESGGIIHHFPPTVLVLTQRKSFCARILVFFFPVPFVPLIHDEVSEEQRDGENNNNLLINVTWEGQENQINSLRKCEKSRVEEFGAAFPLKSER